MGMNQKFAAFVYFKRKALKKRKVEQARKQTASNQSMQLAIIEL